MPPLLTAMNQEPLFPGVDFPETFQRPAVMQTVVRPARHDKGWHRYLGKVGILAGPVVIKQRMPFPHF